MNPASGGMKRKMAFEVVTGFDILENWVAKDPSRRRWRASYSGPYKERKNGDWWGGGYCVAVWTTRTKKPVIEYWEPTFAGAAKAALGAWQSKKRIFP